MSDIVKDFVKALKSGKETSAYDTTAVVTRVEDDVAWVHIAGGVDETPVRLTINAKAGDSVQVRVSGGRAWLTGNMSAPPTDNEMAQRALDYGKIANDAAQKATADAQVASEAASSASRSAEQAQRTAESVEGIARHAEEVAEGVEAIAERAETSAGEAKASAENASEYAARALGNLSTVQNVTETLNWITAHGTMTLTSDIALDPTHVYFVLNDPPTGQTEPHGDYYVGSHYYDVVTEPSVDDISTYYELSIDESLNNYVATHLAVDSEGLWLLPDMGSYKILIAVGGQTHDFQQAGTYIIHTIDGRDTVVAKFTSNGNVLEGSIAGGKNTSALGYDSFAFGDSTQANGSNYAFGFGCVASGAQAFVIGRNNIPDTEPVDAWGYRKYAFIVGNGDKSSSAATKRNAFAVDWDGNTGQQGRATTKDLTSTQIDEIIQELGLHGRTICPYDVGDIYITRNSTNPATKWQGTTWRQIKDTFLLAAGDDYTAGDTGGEAEVTLTDSEIPSHTHNRKTLSGTASIYGDTGLLGDSSSTSGIMSKGTRVSSSNRPGWTKGASYGLNVDASHEHDVIGNDQPHNNMPPYLVVYAWERLS